MYILYRLPGCLAQKNFKLFLTGLSANLSLYRKCTAWDSPDHWWRANLDIKKLQQTKFAIKVDIKSIPGVCRPGRFLVSGSMAAPIKFMTADI